MVKKINRKGSLKKVRIDCPHLSTKEKEWKGKKSVSE
jgi:hypothetical protein